MKKILTAKITHAKTLWATQSMFVTFWSDLAVLIVTMARTQGTPIMLPSNGATKLQTHRIVGWG